MKKFTTEILSYKEINRIKKFMKKQNSDRVELKFSHASGIGLTVIATCGDETLDVTDYSTW